MSYWDLNAAQLTGVAIAIALLILVPAAIVFYVVRTVRRGGWRAIGNHIERVLAIVAPVLAGAISGVVKAIGWAAGSVDKSVIDTTGRHGGKLLFGSFNHRTQKMDDGLDPYGIYSDDEDRRDLYR